MIPQERIQQLNTQSLYSGDYVTYWMQASQRVQDNHALEFAIQKANELCQPLMVFFGLIDSFPEANERHYRFMLDGLKETTKALEKRDIPFIIQRISPEQGIVQNAKHSSLIVVDRGYLRIQRHWRQFVAEHIRCPLIQVESDVIVPIETASLTEEYTAATIRPKIHRHLQTFLVSVQPQLLQHTSLKHNFESLDLSTPSHIIASLPIDHHVKPSPIFHGGTSYALRFLHQFIQHKLPFFSELRNDPSKDYSSHLSPYLHFGQISPLTIALQIQNTADPNIDTFLEELIIRRELSMNFVYYNQEYDSFNGLPSWAKTTLFHHTKDPREYLYTKKELEHADTHDSYWNTAQRQMTQIGKMHGYMRMYWGKKILEWTKSPQEAFQIAVSLNNTYELDGRDPNGFAGVAWCFGKHDHAWQERPIFGKIRYMNQKGLERKFNMKTYIKN